ncbi:MAG TPA: hypothetical protein DCS43_16025 [Verrucomicrobia bacterium]|nr:hypothetical protein [Verrucomicrobiota bacterium]
MAQIREKRYAEPYLDDGRPITLVGVEFSGQARNLGAHRIEALDGLPLCEPAAIREESVVPYGTAEGARRAEREAIARRLQARGIAPDIIADVT